MGSIAVKPGRKGRWTAFLVALAGCTLAASLAIRGREGAVAEVRQPAMAVETLRVQKKAYRVRVPAWGFVEPQETIDIRSEVPGRIAAVSGGLFTGAAVKQGALLFSIDPRACQNALAQATAALEQARQTLIIEEGRQAIARAEWKLLAQSEWKGLRNKPLALREPQLKTCRAAVQMALARRSQAALDLERTRIFAPCTGVVLKENIAEGQVVDTADEALRMACTGGYRVMASFSAGYLLDPDARTASVRIGKERYSGMILAVPPRVDPQTRHKEALVAFEGKGVVLGAYASLVLPGPVFKEVAVLPVAALRSGNTVWIFAENNTLEIRPVTVLARDLAHVVIGQGLEGRARVILSHIASPLQGMPLRMAAAVARDPKEREG